eukprot:g7442.t1
MEGYCGDAAGAATPPRSTISHGTDAPGEAEAGASLDLPLSGQRRKRALPVSVSDSVSVSDDRDPTEALLDQVKKCRVSSTPGELRLKRDLSECDKLRRQGIARFDKAVGNPLKCQLTFLRPIGGTAAAAAMAAGAVGPGDAGAGGVAPASDICRRVPTTFEIVVPKFYPHDPPLLYAERCYSRTCPFVREDGLLLLPFLSTGVWSSVSTMTFVAETLLQGLQRFAAGQPQPWGPIKASSQGYCSRADEALPTPVACLARVSATNEPTEGPSHVADSGAGGGASVRYCGEGIQASNNSSSSSTGSYSLVGKLHSESGDGNPHSMDMVVD